MVHLKEMAHNNKIVYLPRKLGIREKVEVNQNHTDTERYSKIFQNKKKMSVGSLKNIKDDIVHYSNSHCKKKLSRSSLKQNYKKECITRNEISNCLTAKVAQLNTRKNNPDSKSHLIRKLEQNKISYLLKEEDKKSLKSINHSGVHISLKEKPAINNNYISKNVALGLTRNWQAKNSLLIKNLRNNSNSKTGGRPPLFPSTLPPFENPKDGLLKTLLQMENPEWEVVMLGLQGLVRLCRHHSKLVISSSHSVVQSLVNNIRNLRSQVSRGSCQVAKELFDKVGRFLDGEVEDLAGTLLSRTADTNKFLRGDALSALESMVDHTNPIRSIAVLVNKGAKHQNALVRCSTARLLLRLSKKYGAERTLSLPRETKDSLVITTAKLLMEGSLETRRNAREVFEVLSSDSRLFPLITEVVPNNILRNINKSLSKIAARSKE